jgi:hypothetical protein
MIERIMYRGGNLPAYYEVTTWSQSDDTIPEETAIIPAGMLDDCIVGSEFAREDIVYHAASALRKEQGTDLSHSMKLMRPAETMKYLRPFVRSAIWETAVDRVVATLPFDLLSEKGHDFQADLATAQAFSRAF